LGTSRPGLRQGSKSRQIDFGVEGGGVETLVTKQLRDVSKRSALAKHLSGQGMPEQMSPFVRRINAGFF